MIGISLGTGLSDAVLMGFTPTSVDVGGKQVDLYVGKMEDVDAVLLPRHGMTHQNPPHMIDHGANMKALQQLGVASIIGLSSAGSLKRLIRAPSLVIPDDYIEMMPATTSHEGPIHVIPGLSERIRDILISTSNELNIRPLYDRGIYYQTQGPRLETLAEVKYLSSFADVVGMTMGSEATICCELGLEYASLCTVDNYAHGVGTEEELRTIGIRAKENTANAWKVVEKVVSRL